VQNGDRRSGRHRAPPTSKAKLFKLITVYALIALSLGAIFAIGWGTIALLSQPAPPPPVSAAPQQAFGPTLTSTPPTTSLTHVPTVPDNKDCGSFFDQDDAQKYFIAKGGPKSDPDSLDLDKDGQACENYAYSTSSTSTSSTSTTSTTTSSTSTTKGH
jgi:hypothetical protein